MSAVLRAWGDGTYGAGTYGGAVPASVPQWVVVIPDAANGWRDVGCDVRSLEVHAGRTSYVEAFSAATARVVFANDDGRYSAWTPNSVWAGADGFVTGVPIRIGVALDGAIGWRFAGTTDSVADSWPGFVDAQAEVSATDGFKLLARANLAPVTPTVGADELTGARVARLADAAGWAGPRALDAGKVPLQATDLGGVALESMRKVGESEWGWLFIDAEGALTFRQRDAGQTDPRMVNVQYLFTDQHFDATPPATGTPILWEAFDSTAAWSTTMTITASGRTGNALTGTGTVAATYTVAAGSRATRLVFGFGYRRATLPTTATESPVCRLEQPAGTNQLTLMVGDTGYVSVRRGGTTGAELGRSAAGVISAGAWRYLEVDVTVADAGTVTVWADGAAVLGPLAADTMLSGTGLIEALTLSSVGSGVAVTYDDLYLSTGAGATRLGPQSIAGPYVPPPASAAPQTCYGDATFLEADESTIVNTAQVTPVGHATMSTSVDSASRAHFGPRTWTRTDLLIRDDTDALALAQAVVNYYKADVRRVDTVTIDAANHADAWPAALGCRITDRVRFVRHLPGGQQVDAELLVQGRVDRLEPSGVANVPAVWSVEFATASASSVADLGRWDVGKWDLAKWGT